MSSKTFLRSILLPSHQKDFYLTGFSPHRIFTSQDFLFRQVLGAVQRLPPGASLASTSKSGSLSQDDLTCLIREDLKLIVPFQDTSSLLLWRCKAGPLVEAPGPGPPQVHPLVPLQVLQSPTGPPLGSPAAHQPLSCRGSFLPSLLGRGALFKDFGRLDCFHLNGHRVLSHSGPHLVYHLGLYCFLKGIISCPFEDSMDSLGEKLNVLDIVNLTNLQATFVHRTCFTTHLMTDSPSHCIQMRDQMVASSLRHLLSSLSNTIGATFPSGLETLGAPLASAGIVVHAREMPP